MTNAPRSSTIGLSGNRRDRPVAFELDVKQFFADIASDSPLPPA
jgi:hypothetical protein